MNHTPGPWIINADTEEGIESRKEMPAGYASIDSLTPVGSCHAFYQLALVTVSDGEGEPMDDGFANAHLIAAAPDMLAALKGVVRIADRKTVEFDAARAAIAKAKGLL